MENILIRNLNVDELKKEKEIIISNIFETKTALKMNIAHFPPRTQRSWNTHSTDQIVISINGTGFILTKKYKHTLHYLSAALIPSGIEHLHGSEGDESFTQISIMCE
jgi:quercetin dioxygenase-like cupin family protein